VTLSVLKTFRTPETLFSITNLFGNCCHLNLCSLQLTFICLRSTTLSYDIAHRTIRSWRQNSFDWFSRWLWNTLRNYMSGVVCCRKEWGKRYTMRCMERRLWGGREIVNRKRKLSAVFLQPIQNPSYMSHVLLLCISFLRLLVVLYLRVTCICVA
jgi:hypothetical protein